MCTICGTTLQLSNSPQAERERVFINELIAQGKTKDEIKAALVDEYGPEVLAVPSDDGFDLVGGWILPAVGVIAGATIVGAAAWRWRRSQRHDDDERPPSPRRRPRTSSGCRRTSTSTTSDQAIRPQRRGSDRQRSRRRHRRGQIGKAPLARDLEPEPVAGRAIVEAIEAIPQSPIAAGIGPERPPDGPIAAHPSALDLQLDQLALRDRGAVGADRTVEGDPATGADPAGKVVHGCRTADRERQIPACGRLVAARTGEADPNGSRRTTGEPDRDAAVAVGPHRPADRIERRSGREALEQLDLLSGDRTVGTPQHRGERRTAPVAGFGAAGDPRSTS